MALIAYLRTDLTSLGFMDVNEIKITLPSQYQQVTQQYKQFCSTAVVNRLDPDLLCVTNELIHIWYMLHMSLLSFHSE